MYDNILIPLYDFYMNKVIKYVKGDINQLVGEGDKIITFVCIDNKNLGK